MSKNCISYHWELNFWNYNTFKKGSKIVCFWHIKHTILDPFLKVFQISKIQFSVIRNAIFAHSKILGGFFGFGKSVSIDTLFPNPKNPPKFLLWFQKSVIKKSFSESGPNISKLDQNKAICKTESFLLRNSPWSKPLFCAWDMSFCIEY